MYAPFFDLPPICQDGYCSSKKTQRTYSRTYPYGNRRYDQRTFDKRRKRGRYYQAKSRQHRRYIVDQAEHLLEHELDHGPCEPYALYIMESAGKIPEALVHFLELFKELPLHHQSDREKHYAHDTCQENKISVFRHQRKRVRCQSHREVLQVHQLEKRLEYGPKTGHGNNRKPYLRFYRYHCRRDQKEYVPCRERQPYDIEQPDKRRRSKK